MEMASHAKEQFHILDRELSGEPNGERDMHIFTLRYPYGYTVPEIARMFKMKLKDAENVIGRCQRILRDANKDEPRKGESGNGEPGKSERRKGKSKKDEPEKDEPGKVTSG